MSRLRCGDIKCFPRIRKVVGGHVCFLQFSGLDMLINLPNENNYEFWIKYKEHFKYANELERHLGIFSPKAINR